MITTALEMGSVHSLHDLHDTPLPTPPEEKKAATVKRLSYVVGFIYSFFLIILAVLIYVKTSGLINDPLTPIITIYITVSSLIILCALIADVKLFTRRIRKQVEDLKTREDEHEQDRLTLSDDNIEEDDLSNNDTSKHGIATGVNIQGLVEVGNIEHSYCFAQGRHAGSVYLKFGATAFALGHFVHTLLLVVTVHWSIMISNGQCINTAEYIASLLQCLYCFVQLFFIFTYSNLIIAKNTTIMRLAFLHMMVGNICLWVSAVTTETKLAYKAYEWMKTKKTNLTDAAVASQWDETCRPTEKLMEIFDSFSAYLYPFTVEFNILVVGVFFVVWRNIGKCCHSSEEVQDFHHSLYAQSNITGDVNSPHVLDIHISCRSAMCGLFSSLFVLVILIVSIIIGFVLGNIDYDEYENISQYAGQVFEDSIKLAFHTTMLITTGVAFYKTKALDINQHPVPWVDDVLLYICVPAFFIESMLTITPTINELHIVKFLDTITMSLQMMVQIAFIIDGLRRCSNSRKLRRTKPGRELVLFLLVTNVSMWVLYTFSYKSPESSDVRYVYYGKKVWLAIGHLCAPIIMFFRFHSSVCIADIWSHAYKPGTEDH